MKGRKKERRMDEKPKENLGVALLHVPQHVGVEMDYQEWSWATALCKTLVKQANRKELARKSSFLACFTQMKL